jgi:hypothetical protein
MGDLTPINDIYRLITGKDWLSGEKESRLEAALWLTLSAIPVAKLLQMAKEIRAGNKLLKGVALTEKEIAILTKAGYFDEVKKGNNVAYKVKKKGETTGNGANSPKNIYLHEKHKEVLRTTEKANSLVESLRKTGKLPNNFVSKDIALKKGWRPGKALENYVSGGQIGGDIYKNSTKILPTSPGRVWREADVGLVSNTSRAKQPGTRLLYSNDGLLYITTDHYKTVHLLVIIRKGDVLF